MCEGECVIEWRGCECEYEVRGCACVKEERCVNCEFVLSLQN